MSDSSPEALFFVDLRVFKVASGEKFCGVVTKSVEAVDFIFRFSLLMENASVVLSSWAEAAQYRQLPQSRAACARWKMQNTDTKYRQKDHFSFGCKLGNCN